MPPRAASPKRSDHRVASALNRDNYSAVRQMLIIDDLDSFLGDLSQVLYIRTTTPPYNVGTSAYYVVSMQLIAAKGLIPQAYVVYARTELACF